MAEQLSGENAQDGVPREALSESSQGARSTLCAYDAVLVLSFGGPEKPDEVIPFLEKVLSGRNVPRERMLEVAEHYYHFGGKSPINDENRALIGGLERELTREGPALPVYWGNRNWHPFLADALRKMRADGVRRALCFVTSVFSSYSGCRQYLEDIERARAEVGPDAPRIDKLRSFYNHPLFIEVQVDCVRRALEEFPEGRRADAGIIFTAHSIPLAMAEACDYCRQLQESCHLVGAGARPRCVASGLPEPQRSGWPGLAGARYRRRASRHCPRQGCRNRSDRLHLGSYGGGLRSGHGGSGYL